MADFIINGGKELCGEFSVQGAKNSVLPILAACILAQGVCYLDNCPVLSDTEYALEILRGFGCTAELNGNTVTVNSSGMTGYEIRDELMRKMRSSIMFLGAILGRCGKARISRPGGCDLGPRPIELHISALEKMGVNFIEENGYILCEAPGGIKGADINLAFPSVGATENIMLSAVLAEGSTVILGAAREPEINDLQDFLNTMGAKVRGAGTDTVVIEGVKKLHGASYKVMPDRIATATYISALVATGGEGILHNTEPAHLMSVLACLNDAGANLSWDSGNIYIKKCHRLHCVNLRTMPYPGFPTDAQPPLMALMSTATGSSVFIETIFDNRYNHVNELVRMGAKIRVDGRVAVVEGVRKLSGATVRATDLRGGAALIIAGLAAEGETVVESIFHVERGYENIEQRLKMLGADIVKRESNT